MMVHFPVGSVYQSLIKDHHNYISHYFQSYLELDGGHQRGRILLWKFNRNFSATISSQETLDSRNVACALLSPKASYML